MERKVTRRKLSAADAELLDALLARQARKDRLLDAADSEARQRYHGTASTNIALAEAELLMHVHAKEQRVHSEALAGAAPARRAGLEKVREARWPRDETREARRATTLHLRAAHGWGEQRIASKVGVSRATVRRDLSHGGPIRSEQVRCPICKTPSII